MKIQKIKGRSPGEKGVQFKRGTSDGYMVKSYPKPNVDRSLKMRQMTDAEIALADKRAKYTKNGKVTWKGAAKVLGDAGKKIIKRATGRKE